jgi:hypothetical protein
MGSADVPSWHEVVPPTYIARGLKCSVVALKLKVAVLIRLLDALIAILIGAIAPRSRRSYFGGRSWTM